MIGTKLRSMSLAIAMAGGLLISSGIASANVVYNWTGTCTSGCTGTATATLTLKDDHIQGMPLEYGDFYSLEYTSSSGSYSYDSASNMWGTLDVMGGLAVSDVAIYSPLFFLDGFATNADGTWASLFSDLLYPANNFADYGDSYGWSMPVPEPGSIALFGLGLAGIGFLRRRRTARQGV